jgi:hypothetical protein
MEKNKKRNIGVAEIRGNEGGLYKVITGLKEGGELLCIKTQRSTSGLGFWSTEKYDAFEEGKIYKVHHITNWSGVMVAYVLDEDATLTWVTPETFKLNNKK